MSKILFFIFTACSLLFVACSHNDVQTDVLMEDGAADVEAEVVNSAEVVELADVAEVTEVADVAEVTEVEPYILVEEIDQMIEEVLSEVEEVITEGEETAEGEVTVEIEEPMVQVIVPEVVEVVEVAETIVSPEVTEPVVEETVTETVVVEPVATSCVPDIAGHMSYIHTNGLLADELNKTNYIKGPSGCHDALIGLGTVSGDLVSVHAFWVVDTCRNESYYNYNLTSKTLVPEKSRSQCANQEWSAWQNY